MDDEESILTNPPNSDVATHVRDYEHFIKVLTRSAIACLAIAFLVLMILK